MVRIVIKNVKLTR